jgi:hypothetical protein
MASLFRNPLRTQPNEHETPEFELPVPVGFQGRTMLRLLTSESGTEQECAAPQHSCQVLSSS